MFVSMHDINQQAQLGFKVSKSTESSMYLGQWRDQISNKLNPSYFNRLVGNRLNSKIASNHLLDMNYLPNFTASQNQFMSPVFTDNAFSTLLDDKVYFSFASDSIKVSPSVFDSSVKYFNSSLPSKFSKATLLEQSYYKPGYVFSNGNSSFGVAAILVQQSFLDDSLGSTTIASSSNSLVNFDNIQRRFNRGIGYQLNFNQKLFSTIDFTLDFQSKVNMNEFDAFGRSYSDKGDFDIPSQYTVSFGIPVFGNKLRFSADRIAYSEIESRVHSGFSQDFLDVFNGLLSPNYKLDDLTVYSVKFEQNINRDFSWNIELTSRQQAPATSEIYDRILSNDTAAVSYKLGLSHTAPIGQFNFYASFANKPLFMGATDFGRYSSSGVNRHIEGVVSWSMQF